MTNRARTVVRLATATWWDGRRLHATRSLTVLRRDSGPEPFLVDDLEQIGAAAVAARVQNLHWLRDGVYTVEIVNVKRDWETGHVEDYDYLLRPIEEAPHG